MAYRDDIAALSARHDALADEVAEKTRELEESRRLLDHAQERAKLPVLDNIGVASPCTADWNQMTGDERTRHCGECKKNVYNLSGMTRDEAEALLIERNGDLCVRYFQRHDGTILLADCTVGVKRRNRRRWIAVGAATLLVGGVGAAGRLSRIECAPPMMTQEPVQGQWTVGEFDTRPASPPPSMTPPVIPAPKEGWTMGTPPPIAPSDATHRPGRPAHPVHSVQIEKLGKLVRH
jgi:hypothetical protein